MDESNLTETRNEVRLDDGRIECQLNHPVWGWVDFTADTNDPEIHGRELFASLDAKLGGTE